MTLGELIGQIERQTGTSITDPVLLALPVVVITHDGTEFPVATVDVDGDVIVLE